MPSITRIDRRYRDLAERYPVDAALMLVAEVDHTGVGGALGFRADDSPHCAVTLRILAIDAAHRGRGLGRRLMAEIERTASQLAAVGVQLGAGPGVRAFYRRLGYTGKSRMYKPVPSMRAGRRCRP
jgi:GNAT superfamily N-acetyltransferase